MALALQLPVWFAAAIGVLFLLAYASATHDIACDGLYMGALDSKQIRGLEEANEEFRILQTQCAEFDRFLYHDAWKAFTPLFALGNAIGIQDDGAIVETTMFVVSFLLALAIVALAARGGKLLLRQRT